MMGTVAHAWVAALTARIDESEVPRFQRRALGTTEGKGLTGRMTIGNRGVDVLDVYCRRCGVRPGRAAECPFDPMRKALA